MDAFDYKDQQLTPDHNPRKDLVWNILTVVALLATACVGAGFLLIFTNPQSSINPFPPPTLVTPIAFPTATATARIQMPPTWTPVPTQKPSVTPTLVSTSTPEPSATPYILVTETLTPTLEMTATRTAYHFVIQQGNPIAISSLAFRPEYGCSWMGIGGQVFDLRGSQVSDMFVYLGGMLAGTVFSEQPTITGLLPQYGRGYYEFKLADAPVASQGSLWVQLRDQAGLPMSDKYYFNTFDSCEKNLVIINFKQTR